MSTFYNLTKFNLSKGMPESCLFYEFEKKFQSKKMAWVNDRVATSF